MTRENEPVNQVGMAVAGTIAGPKPSNASEASNRTPSISACGRRRHVVGRGSTLEQFAQRRPRRRQQEGFVVELADRDGVGSCEPVIVVDEEEQVLGEERLHDQFRFVDREVDDRCVEFARHHVGDERRRRTFSDDGPDARVIGGELTEQRRGQPPSGGADDADPGLAGHVVVSAAHVGGDVLDLVEHPAGAFDDAGALLGQLALGPIDERHPELLLEARHVSRDVRLHGVQRSRRGREGAVVGDRDDRCELPNIHR